MIQLSAFTTVVFRTREEWKSITTESGALFVMTPGTSKTQQLCVANWDTARHSIHTRVVFTDQDLEIAAFGWTTSSVLGMKANCKNVNSTVGEVPMSIAVTKKMQESNVV